MFQLNDILITHKNCMDGAACAIIFLLFGGTKKNIIFSSPSHPVVDLLVYEALDRKPASSKLYLADISVSEPLAARLNSRKDVFLFDHHKSAIPLGQYEWCNISEDNSQCGSLMFYDWCKHNFDAVYASFSSITKGNVHYFLMAVDDRDRWLNRVKFSTELADLFYLLGTDLFIERFLQRVDSIWESPAVKDNQDEYILFIDGIRKKEYMEKLQEKVAVKNIGGKKIGFVVCDRYVSEAGHVLCDNLELDAIVLVSHETISLRAPEHSTLDMSEIARQYRGGGHKGAAGFQIKDLLGETVLSKVMTCFQL